MAVATVFSLRLPVELDKRLRGAAEVRGTSLNAEIVQRLDSSFGADPRVGEVLDALELPRAVRVRHANTTKSVQHILQMAELFNIDRLVLAARVDPLNDAVLVLLMQTASHTIVLDRTMLNMARRPRMLELAELFRGLDERGLLDGAEYQPKVIPADGIPASVEDAAAILLSGLKRLEAPAQILKLLAPHGQYDVDQFRAPKASKARVKGMAR
jgi:hypothetical protein